jgi:hypothetical protein
MEGLRGGSQQQYRYQSRMLSRRRKCVWQKL